MIVVAHRGASYAERENTLPAFERAIAMGAEWIEFDVQASSDGVPVVFHDLRLDRLTEARGPMRARTAAELHELGVPTLDAVLELAQDRIGVMPELKSPWLHRRHDLVRRTAERVPKDAVIVSFSRAAIEETRRLRPRLRTVQHVGYGTSIRTASRIAWAAGFDDGRVTARGVARAHRLGLEALVYTVNDPGRMLALRELGVDGIFSDRPDLALRTLRPAPPG